MRGRLMWVAMVAVGACCGLASQAGASVYWANAGNDTIGRANLDGTGVNHSFNGHSVTTRTRIRIA